MSELDIEGILRELASEEVAYVLIGATALAAHGPVRATEDVDLVPSPDPENLRRLGNVLTALDARLASDLTRAFGTQERSALAQGRNLSLETRLGSIDVVQRLQGVPSYDVLADRADRMELFGVPALVSNADDLRAMKLARATHRDLADVEDLDRMSD